MMITLWNSECGLGEQYPYHGDLHPALETYKLSGIKNDLIFGLGIVLQYGQTSWENHLKLRGIPFEILGGWAYPLNTIWKRVQENLIAKKCRWIWSYPCQSSQVFLLTRLTHQCCVQWNDSRHSPVLLSYITHRLYSPWCHMFYQRIICRHPSAYNSLVSPWLLG